MGPVDDGGAATSYDGEAVAALHGETIATGTKGVPPAFEGGTLGELARSGIRLPGDDAVTPALLLKAEELQGNIEAMAAYCRANGALLAPHGKTTMAPQIMARQIDAGAWAMTAATAAHCRMYRRFGIGRILLANQLISPSAIAWVCEELRRDPDFELFCLVDSLDGVALLDAQLNRFGGPRPLPVLAEVGFSGGRAGARDGETLEAIAAAARAAANLELVGLECYEGLFAATDIAATLELVEAYLQGVADSFLRLREAGLLPPQSLLSAGGSAFFDLVVAKLAPLPGSLVLRSGCYVTQDGGFYEEVSPLGGRGERVLENAIELWSTVLSQPEPGFAVADFGRRDAPFDQGLPRPTHRLRGAGPEVRLGAGEVVRLSDQHSHLSIPASEQIEVGDLLRFSISHPCGAFDRWRVIPIVDREHTVVDAVVTFF